MIRATPEMLNLAVNPPEDPNAWDGVRVDCDADTPGELGGVTTLTPDGIRNLARVAGIRLVEDCPPESQPVPPPWARLDVRPSPVVPRGVLYLNPADYAEGAYPAGRRGATGLAVAAESARGAAPTPVSFPEAVPVEGTYSVELVGVPGPQLTKAVAALFGESEAEAAMRIRQTVNPTEDESGFVCANCGGPIEAVRQPGLPVSWLHADGQKYRHPCYPAPLAGVQDGATGRLPEPPDKGD